MAKISTEKRRLYIETAYGEPCVEALKDIGARWDADRRAWWVGVGKRERVEEILSQVGASDVEAGRLAKDRENILGRATFGGHSYYVVGRGTNERGDWVRLMFRDGSKSFFKSLADVEVTKIYQRPTTLERLREFAEQMRVERELEADPTAPYVESCDECGASYKTEGNVWDEGMSCRRCG